MKWSERNTLFEIFILCPKIQHWFPEKIVDFLGWKTRENVGVLSKLNFWTKNFCSEQFCKLCLLWGMQFCVCVLHQIIDFFGFSLLHLASFLPIFSMIASQQCRLILKVLAMRGGFRSLSLPKAHETSSHKTAFSLLLHKSFLSDYSALITWLSLEATVVKNVDKIFSYFSNFSPDFKSGAKILWISFPTFLRWMIIGFLIHNFFASKWKPGKIFDKYFYFFNNNHVTFLSIFAYCDAFIFIKIGLSGWSLICCFAAKPF